MAKIMSVNEAINRAIEEEMRRDPSIFIFGWLHGGGNERAWIEEFGRERIACTGICETQIAGAGIGAALAGMRPIADLWLSDGAMDGWGQIVVQAANIRFKLAYQADCPVVFKMDYGRIGAAAVHHSSCFHNWLANAPGILVATPATAADAIGLWRTALREAKDPVVMLSEKAGNKIEGSVPERDYTIPFGKADIKREGSDVTIAAVGAWILQLALEAAEDLAKEGIDAEVWDPRTLIPFDRKSLIKSVSKTGALVAVDHACRTFGTTGEFAMTVAEALDAFIPMARVTSLDASIAQSPPLEKHVIPNKDKVISAVKGVLKRKG